METHSDGTDEITAVKELRQQHETRIQTLHNAQLELIASLQTLVPDIVSSLDLSLKTISSFNGKPFAPLPNPLPNTPNPNPNLLVPPKINPNSSSGAHAKPVSEASGSVNERDKMVIDECGGPLSLVRAMVAVCLLERVPFTAIDSSTLLRKLENDQSHTAAEKTAIGELGGESGPIMAVEMALKSMAEDNACVELENFVVSGKSRVMVLNIDRTRLLKELPESKQNEGSSVSGGNRNNNNNQEMVKRGSDNGGFMGMGRAMSEMWEHSHMQGMTAMFPGNMGPRGGHRGMVGMMGMPRGVGVPPPMPRPPMGPNGGFVGGGNSIALKPRTEEDDMKDLENMLNKKSFKEMQKSKTGEELLDLIHRPTAKESAVAARFKSKGGSQVKEYCSALTKEDCRRQSGSYIACDKVHFRRIIAVHTDVNLGDCSFLDTCRHMKTCKYVHYELDSTPDVSPMMMGAATLPPPKSLKPQRAHYCSEVELGEPQWINCDIRSFRVDILGQFGIIMADPPWDIHMELPYGTMADDEMRTLNVPALQTDGLIFLWVTGRAMELGRECLELWGYKRVEEIIWVKTNQLQRIIRTGRTGHWLNHSKEHCLVGIKGNPEVNRNIDTDVIVAEVRETSRKPDEMYPLLERISPRTRKLELFARMHNVHAGWMALGNQLQGVRLVDEGLRARFKAAYPDVEVQPASPPRASAMEVDSSSNQMKNAFAGGELKTAGTQFAEATAPDAACATEGKAVKSDVEMAS
ncbi:PREDICTED: N6-adenosine-methyltransferase MT-A70-like [Nicotiana attenuata]|uniref:N6-adenosine-methyltransferase mt-a70-like protein n=1 Tax=Nicotiana attenuata TaxID=49451 RepID=A0A1J6JV69_NICAT|nr:PREDICTED: N6-adenosine-methyltransferase MT-A70-like [Nicotiana attenuata]OIT20364.1 n6-adenosine-methyltransferase mt-a70-like protein [Nicotiana attenuata]